MRNTSKTKQKAFLILPDVPLDAVCSSCIIETEHKISFSLVFGLFLYARYRFYKYVKMLQNLSGSEVSKNCYNQRCSISGCGRKPSN